jgi:hypothetical protein
LGLASSAATAEPLNFFAKWSLKAASDRFEVTALGDSNKVYVAGLPDASGDFSGWYDDATVQTYTGAVDGQARKFYLYPNTNTSTQYWFGTVFVDFSVDGDVAGAVAVSATWAAATSISKVG